MKVIYSLMASLCPKIKQRTNQPMGTYKPPILLFFLFLCFVFAAKAQETAVHATPVAKAETITGIVVSAETNEPLEGATVKIKGTNYHVPSPMPKANSQSPIA